jgi:opacity protein-like surface antigen
MKKQIVFLLFILFFGKISVAQFYVGADATVVYPFGHLKSQVDFGYGPKFNLGYSLNDKLDFSFSYEILNFKTMQPHFKIMSETLSAKYKFSAKKYKPYLGVKTGIYHSKVEVPSFFNGQTIETSDKKKNAFGFAPMAGVLINTGNSDNWKLDISTAYSILNLKRKYEYLSLNFGVMYSF